MKCNFDRKNNVQEHTPLLPGTPIMVQQKEGDIWTYGISVDVLEPNVFEGHCYQIKLSSGRIITRNSIHVHQTHVPAKTFLTDMQTETNNIPTYIPVSPPSPPPSDPKPIKQDTSSDLDECASKPMSKAKKTPAIVLKQMVTRSKKSVCLAKE